MSRRLGRLLFILVLALAGAARLSAQTTITLEGGVVNHEDVAKLFLEPFFQF